MNLLESIKADFAKLGINIYITRKAVKNINYRVKLDGIHISCPSFVNDTTLARLLLDKQDWLITHHSRLANRPTSTSTPGTLWGKPYEFNNSTEKLAIYRLELDNKIPELQAKWQPIVGKTASEVRIKKMHTRFGTCNTAKARVWLSLYLPAFDYQCCEYVFVHELCHLHYADHSRAFWQTVEQAMPDYRHWHKMLQKQGLRRFGG